LFTSEKASLSLKKFANVLQRFEFTFELCWKALRIHLSEQEGIEVSSPKGTLKEAFRVGIIEPAEERPVTQMLEDRNLSTHVYDEQQALEIFSRV
jgi:nucleotidyltransferase substrate binding protein (TIGR01987 family)